MRARRLRRLPLLLSRYLACCRPPEGSDPKKGGRFPNLAGLCAFLGCGVDEADYWRANAPETYAFVLAVLEDEALNSPLSSGLLNTYLKHRLGYGEKADGLDASTDCGSLRLIFEHDIEEDGA